MRTALHPDRDKEIAVPDHIQEFGKKPVEPEELARCPVCEQRLRTVGASSVDSVGHFAHQRNSDFCPTKSSAAAPYNGLLPSNPDPIAAARIKSSFLANWQKHYAQLNWLVKGLAIAEFTEIILAANREHIWEYARLEPYQLPYVFATLADFPPSRSYKRKDGQPARQLWFRCWFDASVQRYDDLWIHRTTPLKFWRAWYGLRPGKRKPGIEDMLGSYGMELSADFLSREFKLNPQVEREIARWLSRYFRN